MTKRDREETTSASAEAASEEIEALSQLDVQFAPWVAPITLELPPSLSDLVDEENELGQHFFGSLLPTMLQILFEELGVVLPEVHVHSECTHLPADVFCIKIKEVPVGYDRIPSDKIFVNESVERLSSLKIEGEPGSHPVTGGVAAWIPIDRKEIVETSGYVTWQAQEYLILALSSVLRRMAHRFVGIQEVHEQIEKLRLVCPVLVDAVVPNHMSLAELTEVLRRLVEEEVSLRNLRDILEILAQWRRPERDPIAMTEWVRSAFQDYLTYKHAGPDGALAVYLFDSKIENKFRTARKKSKDAEYLALDQSEALAILAAMRQEIGELPSTAQRPILLTAPDIRRDVRQLARLEFPYVVVLSHTEVDFKYAIQPIATITLAKTK